MNLGKISYTIFYKVLFMTALTIGVLKKIIEQMPDDFTVELDVEEDNLELDDRFEIDITLKKLILKRY